MTNYKQPLSVYFVWHHADSERVKESIDYCYSSLQRDSNKPFSRFINIPVFYKTSLDKSIPSIIESQSDKTIVFLLISCHIVADKDYWANYYKNLCEMDDLCVIPVALDTSAFKLGCISDKNFIRAYEFQNEFYKENMLLSVAHEIYRWVLNQDSTQNKVGKDRAIKLFLSHAKDGKQGEKVASSIKKFLDNSTMRSFFDATDIAINYKFDDEIKGNIEDSTLIAIHSDPYSSRYWCQKEILYAKGLDRPIIALDCLEECEDRRFPYATNISGIHIKLDSTCEIEKNDLYRITIAALLETLRFNYSKLLLENYKNIGLIPNKSIILSRPLEISDIDKILLFKNGCYCQEKKEVFYPEPFVYDEELEFFKKLGIQAYTPLNYKNSSFNSINIGLSISDPSKQELIKIGQTPNHLIQLSQDLARHLLANGATLIYGGDLRPNGFTEFLFNEASVLQSRMKKNTIHLKNYIAYPIYLTDSQQVIEWKAKYIDVADMLELGYPQDVKTFILKEDEFLPPSTIENKYVWSRSLTSMREEMITNCNFRICAGGRHSGYKGKMPGVLEEILIAVKKEKPIFLLGGFGGITSSICHLIEKKELPKELTEEWQITHTEGYKDLIDYTNSHDEKYKIDYSKLDEILTKKIVANNGLNEEENLRLFKTPFVDEAIYLIMRGLKRKG